MGTFVGTSRTEGDNSRPIHGFKRRVLRSTWLVKFAPSLERKHRTEYTSSTDAVP